MIEKGMILRSKTNTKNDTFGTVMWEVLEVGLQAPEKGREHCQDGVKVSMIGGSGPSAREGMTVIDSEEHIIGDIRAGTTTIIPAEQKEAILAQVKRTPRVATGTNPAAAKERTAHALTGSPRHGGTGVVEV